MTISCTYVMILDKWVVIATILSSPYFSFIAYSTQICIANNFRYINVGWHTLDHPVVLWLGEGSLLIRLLPASSLQDRPIHYIVIFKYCVVYMLDQQLQLSDTLKIFSSLRESVAHSLTSKELTKFVNVSHVVMNFK